MQRIQSKEQLQQGDAFTKDRRTQEQTRILTNTSTKYDLIGKIVSETGLTRAAVVKILKGLESPVFTQLRNNPEEFILKASSLIQDQLATLIIERITYHKLEEAYDTSVFTEPTLKGKLGVNAVAVNNSVFDYVLYDSNGEHDFAKELDASAEVAVYVKLPSGFYINTPVGKYNPDWAISFYEGTVKHIYFIAETKGSMRTMQLTDLAKNKAHCAREHFRAISSTSVVYDIVDSYSALMSKVML